MSYLFTADMSDEWDMEDAEERFKELQQTGIERQVWNIILDAGLPRARSGWDRAFFRKASFPNPHESPEKYFRRIAKHAYQDGSSIFLPRQEFVLQFMQYNEQKTVKTEIIELFNAEEDSWGPGIFSELHDARGPVEVREYTRFLRYTGLAAQASGRYIPMPDIFTIQRFPK
jgi:hypothetical protein